MDRPSGLGKPQNQATWAIFVAGIVFYDLTPDRNRLLHLRDADVPSDALVNSMLGELILPPQYLAPDFLEHTHDGILFDRSLFIHPCRPKNDFPFWMIRQAQTALFCFLQEIAFHFLQAIRHPLG